ncbi:MAG: hypothetical protein IKX81_01330, partial [Firmicutes bacterium]|nr:hypothetical protein [Bacillota bacterium]
VAFRSQVTAHEPGPGRVVDVERNPLSGKKASVLLICRRGGRYTERQTAALLKKTGVAVQNSGELSVITGGAEEMYDTLLHLARLTSGN